MSSIADGVKTRKREREESGSKEEVSKLKQLKASLSTAELGNTPKDVRKEMGKQWEEMEKTGTHVTDPNNPAFKTLFGNDDDDEGQGEVATEKDET